MDTVSPPKADPVPPPIVHPARDTFVGMFLPRTDTQPNAWPAKLTFWRVMAVLAACVIAAAYVVPMFEAAIEDVRSWITDHKATSTPGGTVTLAAFARYYGMQLFSCTMVLALLAAVAGRRAIGVQRRGPGETALAVGYAARGPFFMTVLTTALGGILLAFLPTLDSGTGSPVGSAWPWWLTLARVLIAGIVEEILLTVLLYWLLERIRVPWGVDVRVAHTWVGTAAILGIWLFLHSYNGWLVLLMAPPFYLKILLWRHSRNLYVLIGLHMGWNGFATILGGSPIVLVGGGLLVTAAGVALERRGAAAAQAA